MPERLQPSSRRERHGFARLTLCGAALLAGCGHASLPIVGQVTFTDAKGTPQPALVSLQHGTATFLDVTILQDPENLGADWTVTCSAALPPGSLPPGMVDTSCGVFGPNHTLSGPVPTYPGVSGIVTQYTAPATAPSDGAVVIRVHATSLPSQTASVTIKIT